jgi:nucleotidyltransferase substrate binding protein (TIGR01987 family)
MLYSPSACVPTQELGDSEGGVALALDSLQKAVSALAAVLAKSADVTFMNSLDDVARNAIKAGVIQHFEFTYELCWKFIKRWLETNISAGVADGVTRRELFRLAAENRLLDDVDQWMRYHEARNLTSHIDQPEIAERVYNTAHEFVHDAAHLLVALEARND